MAQTLDLGLLAGAYHYVGGQGVETEADNFAQAIKPYLRRVLVCIDWEDNDNAAWRDESYLDAQGEAGGGKRCRTPSTTSTTRRPSS